MIAYSVATIGSLLEYDPCPNCGRPLVDPVTSLDRLPAHADIIGSLVCPGCRTFYVSDTAFERLSDEGDDL